MSDRGTGRGISAKDYTPLRKPGEARPQQDGGKGDDKLDSTAGASQLKSSKLNVDAAEFVPMVFKQQQQQSQQFVNNTPQQSNGPDNQVIEYVKEILTRLTESPGEFEICVEDLVLAWKARRDNEETLNEMARVIMEQSIVEPNFTYTGARLSDFLANNTDNIPEGKQFRTVFLKRCREEHCKREEMFLDPSAVSRVHGLAMFLAELYSTFRVEGGAEANSKPLAPLGRALQEMLESLIKNGTDDSLLYAGRILKLTGYLLDDPTMGKEKTPDKVDSIFDQINKLTQPSSQVGTSVKKFLASVINLRKNNWGRESFADQGAKAAAVSVASSVLSPDAKPFEHGYYSAYEQFANQAYSYYSQEDYFNNDDYYANADDDITPVTNPDQWSEYVGDDNSPIDTAYQYYTANGDDNQVEDEDDCAFTDEMQKDFDLFMSELPVPPNS